MTNVRNRKLAKDDDIDSVEQAPSDALNSDYKKCINIFLKIVGILITVVVITLLVFNFIIPCPIEPEALRFEKPPNFIGPLKPNEKLTAQQKLFFGEFRGPESMAIYNNKMYTGVADGRIIEVDLSTNEFKTLKQQLGVPPCGKIANERNCGRPLGVRAKNGYLYVVDAYLGLFRINLETGDTDNCLKASVKMPDGVAPKFLNDVEVDDDGIVYMTDSSTKWTRQNHMWVGFEGTATGRLISFNPHTNETKILLRDQYFINGLEFSHDKTHLLITLMSKCQVIKYYIKGDKVGQTEIWVDNLPGLPDNIRKNPRDGYWVGLAVVRHPNMFSMWDIVQPYPMIKRLMAQVLNKYTIGFWIPKYGLAVELNKDGEIINSLHDPTGATQPAVSEVQEYQGNIYVGSYWLPFLGKLEVEF